MPIEATEVKTKTYQCRHIFTDGHRCGSPALRGPAQTHEPFCFYHHTSRKPVPRRPGLRKRAFDLPSPEDRSAIQAAIGLVLQRLATNDLDSKRAGLILYGLQIAALNLPPHPKAEAPTRRHIVEEVIEHPQLGTLAPDSELQKAKRDKTLEEILTEEWEKEKLLDLQKAEQKAQQEAEQKARQPAEQRLAQQQEAEHHLANQQPAQTSPSVLPSIQAKAANQPNKPAVTLTPKPRIRARLQPSHPSRQSYRLPPNKKPGRPQLKPLRRNPPAQANRHTPTTYPEGPVLSCLGKPLTQSNRLPPTTEPRWTQLQPLGKAVLPKSTVPRPPRNPEGPGFSRVIISASSAHPRAGGKADVERSPAPPANQPNHYKRHPPTENRGTRKTSTSAAAENPPA